MGPSRGAYLAVVACGVAFATVPSAASASSNLNWGAGIEVTLPGDAGTNPDPSINSVSCASAGNCTAVGYYQDGSGHSPGLVLSESGGVWSAGIPAPLPGDANPIPTVTVNSVTCPSVGNCTAVGSYMDTLNHRQGLLLTQFAGTWSASTAPLPGDAAPNPTVFLNSVSCTSAGNCTVAGRYQNSSGQQGLLLSESSGSWTAAKVTPPGDAATDPTLSLGSISCASAGNCVAIGAYRDTGTRFQPLVASETSGSWSAGAQPPRPGDALLNGGDGVRSVSCPATGYCTAAGYYYDTSSHTQGLLLTESAGIWTPLKAALPGDAGADPSASVESVSCASPGECSAVGYYNDASAHQQGVLLDESSGTWEPGLAATPPAGAASDPSVGPTAVSCASAGNCAAVGEYVDSAGDRQALLVGQSSGSWRPGVEADLPGNAAMNPQASLDVVSCPSAGNCVALGDYKDSAGHFQGLLVTAAPASPSVSLTAPSSGSVGNPIAPSSVSAALAGGAGPTGTITFKVFGPQSSPPSSCTSGGTTVGSATLSGNGIHHPSAGFTPSAVGDYWWYVSYGGDTSDNPTASLCGAGMAETVVAAAGALRVGRVTISGSTVSVALKCSGPAGARCPVVAKLSAVEELTGGQVVAETASAHKHKKVVVLARVKSTLVAGQRKTIHLKLNSAGRRLLAKFHRIKVKLTIAEAGKVIFTKTVTLPARKKHKP